MIAFIGVMEVSARPSFEEILENAKRGHSGWMIQLAHAYQEGDGVEKNYVESERWYLKAIACSNTLGSGEAKIADLYRKGLGRPRSQKVSKK